MSTTQPVDLTSHRSELLATSKRLVSHRNESPAIAFACSPEGCTDPCTSDQMLRCLGGCTAVITMSECLCTIALCEAWALSAYMICDSGEKFWRKPAALGSRHFVYFAVSFCYYTTTRWYSCRLRHGIRFRSEDTSAVNRQMEGFDKAEQRNIYTLVGSKGCRVRTVETKV